MVIADSGDFTTLAMSPFSPWDAVPAAHRRNMAAAEDPNPPPPPPCHYIRYRREKEGLTRSYIDGQAYWQRYKANDSMACPQHKHFNNTLDHMVGTSLLGPHKKHHRARHPKANPYYGGCLSDPHGKATVVPGSSFHSDRGQDVTLSGAATIFGFTFTETTGFTNNIQQLQKPFQDRYIRVRNPHGA